METKRKSGGLPPGLSPNTLNLRRLTTLSQCELALLYAESPAGAVPRGESAGRAIFVPRTRFGAALSWLGNRLWKGKVFDQSGHGLINKILGMRLVRADVFRGVSWSDGQQSIVLDYRKTSLVAFFIRDEIRCVAPGLYLGKVYIRLPFRCRFCALWFALDFSRS
jgi:hypothetical protein